MKNDRLYLLLNMLTAGIIQEFNEGREIISDV